MFLAYSHVAPDDWKAEMLLRNPDVEQVEPVSEPKPSKRGRANKRKAADVEPDKSSDPVEGPVGHKVAKSVGPREAPSVPAVPQSPVAGPGSEPGGDAAGWRRRFSVKTSTSRSSSDPVGSTMSSGASSALPPAAPPAVSLSVPRKGGKGASKGNGSKGKAKSSVGVAKRAKRGKPVDSDEDSALDREVEAIRKEAADNDFSDPFQTSGEETSDSDLDHGTGSD